MDDAAFRSLVEEVRERTDLPALVRESVELESCGSVLKGRSPFNPDEDPSLVVWPHTSTWRDFSNGGTTGGDCFAFVEKRDGVGFMGALRLLASKAGVEVPGTEDESLAEELRSISERRRVATARTVGFHAASSDDGDGDRIAPAVTTGTTRVSAAARITASVNPSVFVPSYDVQAEWTTALQPNTRKHER